ncbi:hypothetical protein ACFB49_46910 [Sphingomonas sp. DBB INV C78]|uniref:hypothetical protein n=1 Tax=Sphingomonas sp. DBB INV C78 TaxID=3349434 RepID=UPI0036D41B8A
MSRPNHSTGLHAFVSRGQHTGKLLYPHLHRDDAYIVSRTRFERDYVRVSDPAELIGWLEKGYRLRMSNPDVGITAPSLVEPGAIYRAVLR